MQIMYNFFKINKMYYRTVLSYFQTFWLKKLNTDLVLSLCKLRTLKFFKTDWQVKISPSTVWNYSHTKKPTEFFFCFDLTFFRFDLKLYFDYKAKIKKKNSVGFSGWMYFKIITCAHHIKSCLFYVLPTRLK